MDISFSLFSNFIMVFQIMQFFLFDCLNNGKKHPKYSPYHPEFLLLGYDSEFLMGSLTSHVSRISEENNFTPFFRLQETDLDLKKPRFWCRCGTGNPTCSAIFVASLRLISAPSFPSFVRHALRRSLLHFAPSPEGIPFS